MIPNIWQKKKVVVLLSPSQSNFWKFWKKFLVYKRKESTLIFIFPTSEFFPCQIFAIFKHNKNVFKQFFVILNVHVFIFSENLSVNCCWSLIVDFLSSGNRNNVWKLKKKKKFWPFDPPDFRNWEGNTTIYFLGLMTQKQCLSPAD